MCDARRCVDAVCGEVLTVSLQGAGNPCDAVGQCTANAECLLSVGLCRCNQGYFAAARVCRPGRAVSTARRPHHSLSGLQ